MPLFFIHTCNSTIDARGDGIEYDQPETALKDGIKGAISIVSNELHSGRDTAAVEVRIELEDRTCVLRSLVTGAVSPLIVSTI